MSDKKPRTYRAPGNLDAVLEKMTAGSQLGAMSARLVEASRLSTTGRNALMGIGLSDETRRALERGVIGTVEPSLQAGALSKLAASSGLGSFADRMSKLGTQYQRESDAALRRVDAPPLVDRYVPSPVAFVDRPTVGEVAVLKALERNAELDMILIEEVKALGIETKVGNAASARESRTMRRQNWMILGATMVGIAVGVVSTLLTVGSG